jgi:hypothetical protein
MFLCSAASISNFPPHAMTIQISGLDDITKTHRWVESYAVDMFREIAAYAQKT